jgi:hypothetical protein
MGMVRLLTRSKLINASVGSYLIEDNSISSRTLVTNRWETKRMHTEFSNQCLQDVRLDTYGHFQVMPIIGILPSVSDYER